MKFRVIFEYDETSRLWEVMIEGATSEKEALQGFNAVILTACDATPIVEYNRAIKQPDGRYKLVVGQPRQ